MSIIDNIKGADKARMNINIMMIGGRRTGKTSVLAAMQRCFDKEFSGSSLQFSVTDDSTLDVMETKRREIEDIYRSPDASLGLNFIPDANPSKGADTFSFDARLKGSDDVIQLDFFDFPGEWLNTPDERRDAVREQVAKSGAIMITIDTPYMMEDCGDLSAGGEFNELRNRCGVITDLLIENLDLSGRTPPKMVVFVPLKCERYREDGRMAEVRARVRECYARLLAHLADSPVKTEAAITPIFTMGTALFSEFEKDNETLELVTDASGAPMKPLYYLTQEGIKKRRPTPEFCEQPAVLAIAYALSVAAHYREAQEEAKRNATGLRGLLGSAAAWISPELANWVHFGTYARLAGLDEYLRLKKEMLRRFIETADGSEGGETVSELISDPLSFRVC